MNLSPACQQRVLLLHHDPHGAADLAAAHALAPHQIGRSVRPDKIDLGMGVAKHMHMSGLVVVHEYDDAQTKRPVDRDREE